PGMLDDQIEPLRERLRAILGTGDHSWEEVEKRIRLFQPERRAGDPQHFGIAATAVLRRRNLWIRHYNRARDEDTERELSPQRLVNYRGTWYLDAWCHLRKDLRSFALDAIRDARLLDAHAKEIADAELDAHLAAGYGIFAGKQVEWATLRFTPQAARWVSAESWHPQQRSRYEPDGSYVLELPYSEPRELVMDILRHGADVEVLAPPALRQRVADALRKGAQRYG
ncbi:MAG TPA: WYL domain-containing protein, partial [Casimicrobiaceae bacterium]|nr:WYL domain-containing protein [Casimicrobiaceae bacterium]